MKSKPPTTIVIFGATSDLAKKKLYKALFSLYRQNLLPERFSIVGVSRLEVSDADFRKLICESAGCEPDIPGLSSVYHRSLFEDANGYLSLGKILANIDSGLKACSNKLFYLAVAPKYYKTIFENLANSGLTIPCSNGEGWTRVLVEKPFGDNIDTAKDLDELLSKLFREEQIFRIDHYLARETVQNIISFRFSNTIFEPVWNKDYVEKIELKMLEKSDIGERGAFYDDIGALRDVGQNHMLQMLALISMEHPGELKTENIRIERAKVLRSLKRIENGEVGEFTSRGQYKGFREASGVEADSSTETYFKVKAFVENERWEGVPFYIESGKGMREDAVEIKIFFKAPLDCFCRNSDKDHSHENILSFKIKPRETIEIQFWAKKAGLSNDIEPKNLRFSYHSRYMPHTYSEAYEKVLYDCVEGEQMLFTSSEEVAAAWDFITPIVEAWAKGKPELKFYEKRATPDLIF
ncbi:MAG: glucose-6-phosphate dehydrogenase [Candidatus Spechtbacteria bacterium RIFCSPHIGHO2_02_FULL_43_15b]|uniref:Glucose-6-phosphate 1-dehydrogenase n=1 Tax=Candidatus Spechtbacteria bacterium RIFCSPHIGHO2_01_FULL_43_30 TaxID=1802158 RepID=A0A1G2H6Y9_9BACT|nr:MAG: glucose-6-phosphate dehydrogenase [Candidatus Spechtbacteria bacterium RIFCSPHIGHO2_01_FULL_43_30]OGZ58990.1 MAG: glucose-6-phosphate dehydrogenase [Candidatus Spechtbacteria bacterium RIFCSPHIGHO2_02_FULL_43_15b]